MKGYVQKLTKYALSHKAAILPVVLVATMFATMAAAPAVAASTPVLDIDFSAAIQIIFDYAALLFTALLPIAAIGIGFRFGATLLEWVGRMLGDAMRFR